jgi:[acyl-carrier-protein] S-malonyltransferase
VLVIVAPGQGAQTPGFLAPWLELPHFEERLRWLSACAGLDLVHYGTTAGPDEIKDTAVAQPLLVAAAVATAEVLFGGLGKAPQQAGATAGHSVGELGAGTIAGVITPEDAMRLVGVRGRAMASAAAIEATGMTAVLGGTESDVLASIDKHGLTPANINAPGQIVAAGTTAELAAFAADPPPGARLRPLSVAGAFHTRHMAPATDELREAASVIKTQDPGLALLSNRDGAVVRTGSDWMDRIINQVSAPVRWDLCMTTMTSLGVTAMIELPPAGTLTGVARRALPGVQLLAMKSPDDLDAARALIAEHHRAEGS